MGERALGIDFISVLGMPPIPFVELTAALGCQAISIGNNPITMNPHGYPAWSLRDDPAMQRDFAQALKDHAIAITHWEGCLMFPGMSAGSFAGDLDIVAAFGIPRVVGVCLEPDPGKAAAELAALAGLAKERGLATVLEFIPGTAVPDIATALRLIEQIGIDGTGIVIDAMHLFRGGGGLEALRALDPALIGHSQICDVPLVGAMDYGQEAGHERLAPGEGELPLKDTWRTLPRDVTVGLEVPMLSRAEKGEGPAERLAPAVAAARAILADI